MDRLRGYITSNMFSIKRMIKMARVLTKLLLTLIVILFANQSFAEKIPTLTLKDIQDLQDLEDLENGLQDGKEAVKLLRLAAEKGNAEAQIMLGKIYSKAFYGLIGVPRDAKEGTKWYRLAAEQGHIKAQFLLGSSYEFGNGVPENHKEAVKWYRLAAEQGDASSQSMLGHHYSSGEGFVQDYKEALKWYRLAAEQGDALAQKGLGDLHKEGQGVPQNYAIAHMWYNLSATNGWKYLRTFRDNLSKKMTSAAIEKAQDMANECMNRNYKRCGY